MSTATMSMGASDDLLELAFGPSWLAFAFCASRTLMAPLSNISAHPRPVVCLLQLQCDSFWPEVGREWACVRVFDQFSADGRGNDELDCLCLPKVADEKSVQEVYLGFLSPQIPYF